MNRTPHKKFFFYHLPTRGRVGFKLGGCWYVSNVSVIFDCSMMFYYESWMFYNHFIVILYHFLVLTYWHSVKCQLLFFHVFYIAENQYQTESKCHETPQWFFMGQKEHIGHWLRLGGAPTEVQPTRVRQEAQARPGGLCPTRVPPRPPLSSINTTIFRNPRTSVEIFIQRT